MSALTVEMPLDEFDLLQRTARSMASPGATLTGQQRRRLAELARSQVGHVDREAGPSRRSSSDPLEELVHRLTIEPATIRRAWVQELEQAGVPSAMYVEILGLVSRLIAVDTFAFGLGSGPVALPPAVDGPPTGELASDAAMDGGWIPTVGPAFPPTALSLVPGEHRAMLDLHSLFYLSIPDMADLDADRGLHRTQMELVAARTSLLNECFF